jgi:hypothetical protein
VNRRGTCRSFKRYLIKMVEEGLQATDDLEEDRMCIVYDRRGLEFQHIDPNMFNFCKPLIEEMQVNSQLHFTSYSVVLAVAIADCSVAW